MAKAKGRVKSKAACFSKAVSKIKKGKLSEETIQAFTAMESEFKTALENRKLTIAEQKVLGADLVLKHFQKLHANLNDFKAALDLKRDELNVEYNADDIINELTAELQQEVPVTDIQEFSSPKNAENGNSKSNGNQETVQAEQQVPIEARNQNDRGQDRGQQDEGQVLELTPTQREGIVKKLLATVKDHNSTPSNQTKKLSRLRNMISSLASNIDANIVMGDLSGGKRKISITDKDGKQLRAKRIEVSQETLDSQKQLSDRSPEFENFFNKILPDIQLGLDNAKTIGHASVELDMPADMIRSALNAMQKGKYNQNAFDLLDTLEGFFNSGMIPFVERMGQNKRRSAVPVEYYTAVPEEVELEMSRNEEDVDGMGIYNDIELLTPEEFFNIPIWWAEELDAELTALLGEAWTNADFIRHQDDLAMVELFDSAFPEPAVEMLVDLIDEKLNDQDNEDIQPIEQLDEAIPTEQQPDTVLPEVERVPEGSKKNNPSKPIKSRNPKTGVKFQLSEDERNQLVYDVFSEFDRVINPDDIRQRLTPFGYNGANANLFNHDMEYILNGVYDNALDLNADQGKSISFIIGSPGAGKSAISMGATGAIVWDGVFTSSEKLSNFVQRAIEKGITPEVSMVFNWAVNSYANIISRYQRDTNNGVDRRVVPLPYFIGAVNAQSSRAADLREEFGDQIIVTVFDNSKNDNKHILVDTADESKLDWELDEEEIDEIKNSIENDATFTADEKRQFLAGYVKKVTGETQAGRTQEDGGTDNGGTQQELPATETPTGPSTRLAETVSLEEQVLLDAVAEQEKKVVAAYKAFEKKAKSLDKQIQAETPDLFGEKKAPSSPLGFDEIDIKARDKAVKKEKDALERERTELSRLRAQLEKVSGKPSAQTDLFEDYQEETPAPESPEEKPARTYTALDLQLNPDILESDPYRWSLGLPNSFVRLGTNMASLNSAGYTTANIGDVVTVFNKDWVVKTIDKEKTDPYKQDITLIRVNKDQELLREKDVKKTKAEKLADEEDFGEDEMQDEEDIQNEEGTPAPVAEKPKKERKPKKEKDKKDLPPNHIDGENFEVTELGFPGNEYYDALLPSDQALITDLVAALNLTKEYHSELVTIWTAYVSGRSSGNSLLSGYNPNGKKITPKDRTEDREKIREAVDYMNGYVPLMKRESFGVPQYIEMLDNTVAEINEVRDIAVNNLQEKIDAINERIDDFKAKRKDPSVKKDKALKNAIENEIALLEGNIRVEQKVYDVQEKAAFDLLHEFVARRAEQEGLQLSDRQEVDLTQEVLELIHDRPGIEWTWENKLDSVISYAINLRLNPEESSISSTAILHGDPSAEDIAEFLAIDDEDLDANLALTVLNYFKAGQIEDLANALGTAPSEQYDWVYRPMFEKLFSIELPDENLNEQNQRSTLVDSLTNAFAAYNNEANNLSTNTTENEQVQSSGASEGTTGRELGNTGEGISESDQGDATDQILSRDSGRNVDSIGDTSGAEIQPTNDGTDQGRPESDRSKGDRVTRSSKSSGPTNFQHGEVIEKNSFNKNQKFKDNINALKVLITIAEEGRLATPEEQLTLSKYVGFGGLSEIGLNPNIQWEDKHMKFKNHVIEIHELIKNLDPTGEKKYLANIIAGIKNAHYTPQGVIRGIWHGISKAGFNEGSVLEPSAGIGNFITMKPEGIKLSGITAVELDAVTGQILYNLLPKADIRIKGLQDAKLPHNAYDLVISNVPFASDGVFDPEFKNRGTKYSTAAGSIHNYFFAKALDLVRPGGLIAFITSRHTMDSTENAAVRDLISDMGQFMGAVRLPDTTFKGNAGTEVITDIIFIRKYNEGEAKIESQPFLDSTKVMIDDTDIAYNDYYKQHPDMVLGTIGTTSSQFGRAFNVAGDKNANLEEEVKKAVEKIFTHPIFTEQQLAKNKRIKKESNDYVDKSQYEKIGNMVTLPDGEIGIVTGEYYKDEELDKKAWDAGINPNKIRDRQLNYSEEESLRRAGLSYADFDIRVVEKARISKENKPKIPYIIKIRKFATELLMKELNGYPDFEVEKVRTALKDNYDEFVSKYGRLNDIKNEKVIANDVDRYLLLALESRPEGSTKYAPADIFTKRTIKSNVQITEAKTLSDALIISNSEFGTVNVQRIEALLGKDIDTIIEEYDSPTEDNPNKEPLLFKLPDGTYEDAGTYLSGYVVDKYNDVKGKSEFNRNEIALEKVLPVPIAATDIYSPMNARWLPVDIIKDFISYAFNVDANVRYSKTNDEYNVKILRATGEMAEYNTEYRDALWILDHALKGIEPVVKVKIKDSTVFMEDDTTLAKEKYQKLRALFDEWKYNSGEDRRRAIESLYNSKFNITAERNWKGSGKHLTLPGMIGFTPKEHQQDAIWRFLQTMGGILDHMVGAGKSLIMMGIAMEGRRLGKFKKPVIVGLKSQLPSFVRDFKTAYPLAKILFPSDTDFSPKNRKALLNKIATNDWDCVIITHENFTRLKQDPETEVELINELKSELEEELAQETDKRAAEGLRTRLSNYNKKISELKDVKKDEDVLNFTQLGLDFMMVDESQEFKNLEFTTRQKSVRGLGSQKGSKRSFNMLIAARTLQKKYGGDKGVLFASGTPISNTLAEMFLLFKYLRPNYLNSVGVRSFDQWAALYAESYTDLEYYMGKYKEINRFRNFVNAPELVAAYREIADVKNSANLELPRPKANHALVKVEPSQIQLDTLTKLQEFAATKGNAHKDYLGLVKGYDDRKRINTSAAILAMGYAKKLSLDPRLVGFGVEGGKIRASAENIVNKYLEFNEHKGVQLVFSDIGVPKTDNKVQNLYDYLESEFGDTLTQTDLDEIFGADFETGEKKPSITEVKKNLMKVDEKGNKKYLDINEAELEVLISEANAAVKFDVYSELKRLLVEKGIPAEQIAFIHDYPTRPKREALFQKVRDGEVRILLGSTKKLGVGVNVQDRITDLHHLDIPWKPSDLEQRNGRGERQGNWIAKMYQDNKINIHYYATERTLDAFLYELVSMKAKFIAQAKAEGTISRQMADIDSDIDTDTMAAELSGNPIYKQRANLVKKVKELETSKKAFDSEKFRNQDKVSNIQNRLIPLFERNIKEAQGAIEFINKTNTKEYVPTKEEKEEYEKQLKKAKENGYDITDKVVTDKAWSDVINTKTMIINGKRVPFNAIIDGVEYDNSTKAGDAISAFYGTAMLKYRINNTTDESNTFSIGSVNGINIVGKLKKQKSDIALLAVFVTPEGDVVKGERPMSTNGVSAGIQLKEAFKAPQGTLEANIRLLENNKADLPSLIKQSQAVFTKQDEYEEKKAELERVEIEIKKAIKAEAEELKNRNKGDDETPLDDEDIDPDNPDFLEDGAVQYARSSNGDTVPFKIFGTGENDLGIPVHDQEDFSSVKREFEQRNYVDLNGKTTIKSIDDVAWMFRFLEDEAIEHTFAVYQKKDGSYVVHHMTIGSATNAMVDMQALVAAASKMDAEKVFFIHNHPSGNLVSSNADRMIMEKAKKALYGIAKVEAIIINLKSGQYATFDEYGNDEKNQFDQSDWDLKELTPQNIYTFSKQYFVTGFTPKAILSSVDAATLVSTRRFGAGPKIEMLVMNNANNVIAKFSLPFTEITVENSAEVFKHISQQIVFHGGSTTIIYGNTELDQRGIKLLNERMQAASIRMLDYIQVKSQYDTISYADEGFLHDGETPYKQAINEVRDSAGETDRFDKLDTLAFVSATFKNLSKEGFLALHPQLPMFDKRDLRIAYEKMEALRVKIESNILDVDAINNIKSVYSFNTRLADSIDHYYRLLKLKKQTAPAPAPVAPQPAPAAPIAPAPAAAPEMDEEEIAAPVNDGYETEDGFLKSFKMRTSDVIAQMQSGKRLDTHIGETGDDSYMMRSYLDIGADGDTMIELAQERFGYDILEYGPKLLELIERSNWNNDLKKITLTGRLIRAIETAIVSGNTSPVLKTMRTRATGIFMKLGNTAALSLNAMRELYQVLAQENFTNFYTKDMLSTEQKHGKDFYDKTTDSMVTDDIAQTGSSTTQENVKEAQEKEKKSRRPKKNSKKTEGDPELYKQKAAEAASKINIDDIRDRTKNLEC